MQRGRILFSPKDDVLPYHPSPSPALCPISTLVVAKLKAQLCDEPRAVPLRALLRGETGGSPGLGYVSKLIGGKDSGKQLGDHSLVLPVVTPPY